MIYRYQSNKWLRKLVTTMSEYVTEINSEACQNGPLTEEDREKLKKRLKSVLSLLDKYGEKYVKPKKK